MTTEDELRKREYWGPGPWQDEPDEVEWITAAGLPGRTQRLYFGAWAGSVGVPIGHPAHGRRRPAEVDVDVHGGLCFVARTPDGFWWLGFSCVGIEDLQPGLMSVLRESHRLHPMDESAAEAFGRIQSYVTYRTLDYVREQCESLAAQLSTMRPW